ncbi:MAG: hypothetical protein QW327_03990 [Candidatus Odinarchaeota archaeon]
MLKEVKLKLVLKEEVRSLDLKQFQESLKDAVKSVDGNNIKVFSNNNLEIIFQLTHEINQAVTVLDDLIVYLRERVKPAGE